MSTNHQGMTIFNKPFGQISEIYLICLVKHKQAFHKTMNTNLIQIFLNGNHYNFYFLLFRWISSKILYFINFGFFIIWFSF